MVDSAEFGTEPDASFPVFIDTENNIVGKTVRMHQVFLEMGYFFGLLVNDEQSGMRADPKVILIVTDHVA